MEVLNPCLTLKSTQKTMLDSKMQTLYLVPAAWTSLSRVHAQRVWGFVEPGIQF